MEFRQPALSVHFALDCFWRRWPVGVRTVHRSRATLFANNKRKFSGRIITSAADHLHLPSVKGVEQNTGKPASRWVADATANTKPNHTLVYRTANSEGGPHSANVDHPLRRHPSGVQSPGQSCSSASAPRPPHCSGMHRGSHCDQSAAVSNLFRCCMRLFLHRVTATSLACTVITTLSPCWQIARHIERRGLRALTSAQPWQPRCPRPRQWQIHASQSSASGKLM